MTSVLLEMGRQTNRQTSGQEDKETDQCLSSHPIGESNPP